MMSRIPGVYFQSSKELNLSEYGVLSYHQLWVVHIEISPHSIFNALKIFCDV